MYRITTNNHGCTRVIRYTQLSLAAQSGERLYFATEYTDLRKGEEATLATLANRTWLPISRVAVTAEERSAERGVGLINLV